MRRSVWSPRVSIYCVLSFVSQNLDFTLTLKVAGLKLLILISLSISSKGYTLTSVSSSPPCIILTSVKHFLYFGRTQIRGYLAP